jgi:opacity protein-like surface antigen
VSPFDSEEGIDVMGTSKSLFIGALASTLFSGVAYAADYIPPPIVDFEPEYELEIGGNLYLRGYIGFTNQQVDRLDNVGSRTADCNRVFDSEFEAGGLAGGAVGYRSTSGSAPTSVPSTACVRPMMGLTATTLILADGTWDGTNDLPPTSRNSRNGQRLCRLGHYYHGITPYVGAGAGVILHDDRRPDDSTCRPAGVAVRR